MKIVIGKSYVNRLGYVIDIVAEQRFNDEYKHYKFVDANNKRYSSRGLYFGEAGGDLMAEFKGVNNNHNVIQQLQSKYDDLLKQYNELFDSRKCQECNKELSLICDDCMDKYVCNAYQQNWIKE